MKGSMNSADCYKKGGSIKGAGKSKTGEKGAGVSHGHKEMQGSSLGHKPIPADSKHGHKAM